MISIGTWKSGSTPAKTNKEYYFNGTIPWLITGDLNDGYINETSNFITERALDNCSLQLNNKGSVLIAMYGATLGKLGILNIKSTTNQACCACNLFGEIYNKYLFYYLMALRTHFKSIAEGGAQPNISREKIIKRLIAIPPLGEQMRIVAKIESILPFIDKYEKSHKKFDLLNNSYKEELKKSILQHAIQGKLVKQDPNDEPAEILINKILDEKRELIKTKQIKKENLSVIYKDSTDNQFYEKFDDGKIVKITDEIPFEIPNTWSWSRLGNILTKLSDGTHKTPKYTSEGIPFLSVKDMSSGKISFDNTKFISKEEHEILYQRCNPEKGDILLSKVGTTGVPVIVDTDKKFSLFVSLALLKFNASFINKEYLRYLLLSQLVQKQCKENTKGVGNKNWVMKDIANTLIVIPNLNIQTTLVNKLDNLFNYIETAE